MKINFKIYLSILIIQISYSLGGGEHNLYAQTKNTYNITDFGAKGDFKTMNTASIQAAIDKASENGGGKVIVPEGKFISGMLVMKSNVELHIEKNGFLLGSIDPFDYKEIDMEGHPVSPKQDDNSTLGLIVAYKADNISITGPGTIDGQGRALALNIDSLCHLGIIKDPNYGNRPNEKVRPKLFRFSMCNNVTIKDATLKSSACWGLSFELCDHLTISGVTVNNRAYWNNDGMDISDCKNVLVANCDINSADDGICLKSYYPGRFNDSVTIQNCTIRSGASAIKFGTASFGGFKNVQIDDIKIFDTYRSAVAIESVDGGDIKNIRVTHIVAKNTGNAIFIRLGNRAGKTPGRIDNIYIGEMRVEVPFGRPDINYDIRASDINVHHNPIASSITGIPGYHVKNVTLENIEIIYPGRASKGQAYFPLSRLGQFPEKISDYPEFSMFGETPSWGFYVRHADGIKMKNITLKLTADDFRPALIFDDARDIDANNINIISREGASQMILKGSKRVTLNNSDKITVKELP